jgi:TolB-like protein
MSRVLAERIRSEDNCPSDEEVRQELSTLLRRGDFHASERNRRFLTYIVEETLQGRADRIKAYSIAIAAFDRSDDFDPLTDPIVRIEASRLRRSLEHYYLTAGKSDRIRIDMPKGSYVATFRHADPIPADEAPHARALQKAEELPTAPALSPEPVSKPPVQTVRPGLNPWICAAAAALVAVIAIQAATYAWHHPQNAGVATVARGPSLVVLPFENVGAEGSLDFIARGLTFEIINSLTRFSDLFVFGPETSFEIGEPDLRATSLRTLQPDYILYGSVYSTDETLRVSAILADARTSRSVWSTNLDRNLSTASLLSVQSDIAEQVATAIGQPYGAVFNLTAEEIATKPVASLFSYQCVVRFRQRWRGYDPREYGDMRACLEQTMKADPGYARAYASLALLDLDTVRFGFGRDEITVDPLQEALELSRRALDIDPNESDAYLALSMAYWFSQDFKASIDAARRGLVVDPHNADLMAELGFRYAFMENWDLSRPLIAEAFARNPGLPSGYRIASFLDHYMHGDYQSALQEAFQIKARYVVYGYLALASAYGQLGEKNNAAAAVAELLKIDPGYGDKVRADLARRGNSPHIVRAVVEGLVKAGLPVPPAQPGD